MGLYSWLDAADEMQIRVGDVVHLLIPKELVSVYGTTSYKGRYDGYGSIGVYDVYEEVAKMNREYLSVDILEPAPKLSEFGGLYEFEKEELKKEGKTDAEIEEIESEKRQQAYSGEIARYNNRVCRLNDFIAGMSQRIMHELYGEDYLREIGIDIAGTDKQNALLKYPLKISKRPDAVYEACNYSKADPKQGCD